MYCFSGIVFATCGLLTATSFLFADTQLTRADDKHTLPKHWAWKAVQHQSLPAVQNAIWPAGPIDHFLLVTLEAHNVLPAPPATTRRFQRRATFDLTGLPPSIHETNGDEYANTPDQYSRLVDRLLASPRFGEQWGQHWLDVVRYAETHGQEQDTSIKNAYRYRDYVIRAWNDNVPYDQFVVEHVAGDLVDPPRIDLATRTNQSVQGTGFWLMTEANHIPIDLRGDESERRENQIEVFSKALLGMTVNCARCHDHKFDAITTEDYYALCGYLQSSSYQQANVADPMARQQALDQLISLRADLIPRILEAYADTIVSSRLPDYLGAALEGVAGSSAQGLNAKILGRWVEVLHADKQDVGGPFYPIWRLAAEKRAQPAATLDSLRPTIVDAWQSAVAETAARIGQQQITITREEGERNYVTSKRPWRPADTLLNFAKPGSEDWITTGLRFGRGPAQVGELLLGTEDIARPTGIVVEASANNHLYSNRFTGILRTRTFEITSDTLWYRFYGKAQAFLVVDSYRSGASTGSVHHGKHLFRTLEAVRNYSWQSHRVARYLGHRVHIEFTPLDDSRFSLSQIVFREQEPIMHFQPNAHVAALLDNPGLDSVDAVAAQYQEMFVQASLDLANTASNPSSNLESASQLVNWLMAHSDLLDLSTDAAKTLQQRTQAYQEKKTAIESTIPAPQQALALVDGSGEDEFVHVRGDHENLADSTTPRRLLTILGGRSSAHPAHGSGRLALAQQLTEPSNPLLARVIVNRVWRHLFGRGIVPTVDDFGVMGQPPSHPQLLDHLADELVTHGWSLKWLIRHMVGSRAYGMSSHPHPADEIDPANRLVHRMPLRRLSAESIRDSMLCLSGRLDHAMHGPSVAAYYTARNKAYSIKQPSGPADGAGRRSIYLEVRRNQLLELLTTFGRPVPLTTVGQRDESPTTAQPLTLLNDPFVHEQARLWAERLLTDSREDHGHVPQDISAKRIDLAYRMAFGRHPQPWETDAAIAFLSQQQNSESASGQRNPFDQWSDLCHTMFNAKEFLFY